MKAFAGIFAAALEVGAPVLLALVITDAAFGVVSRVVPQLNVFAVGFPAKVAVGLLLIGVSLPFVAGWIADELAALGRHRAAVPEGGLTWPSDKTEKATPKRARRRARRARSPARPTSTAPSCCWPRCSRCRAFGAHDVRAHRQTPRGSCWR